MKLSEIKPNPNNPRTIAKDKFKKLCDSISEFPKMMALRPMVIDENNVVLGGNMRLNALTKLGYTEIPDDWVKKAGELTPDEVKRFIVVDNVGYGEWDWNLLAEIYDINNLVEWGLDLPENIKPIKLAAEEDDFDIPEIIKTDIKENDIFQIGNHRLVCGDSTKQETWQALMEGQQADMVLTDPPYNVDYSSKNKMLNYSDKGNNNQTEITGDKQTDSQFYQFLLDFFKASGQITKQGGSWYVWHPESEGANFRNAFLASGLMIKQCLVWIKNQFVIGRQDYQWKHEPCLYGWKPGAAHYFTTDRTKTTVIEDEIDFKKLKKEEMLKMLQEIFSDKTQTTVLKADKPRKSSEHPTMKPILLLAPLIENSSKKNEIVADGFLGSGSTMVAAHQLNRKCYGMELDPKYCQVIVDRMKKLDPTLIIKKNGQTI
jgi:DNA modification methylase